MTAQFDKRAFTWLAAPLCTALLLLAVFALDGAWPFGGGSVSWCDMDQQVLPLLADFKDILAGREGLFLNLPNAGGMDLWSVFFFFLASPFSFLVAFVPKTELFHFANLLVLLKLTTCAGTAAFCLRKKFERLDPVWVAALGMLYALSGYGMLYYQNVIWLDMMALFPLLILSLDALCERGRILPYTAVLAAMVVVNYYIGYMVVVFLMLLLILLLETGQITVSISLDEEFLLCAFLQFRLDLFKVLTMDLRQKLVLVRILQLIQWLCNN